MSYYSDLSPPAVAIPLMCGPLFVALTKDGQASLLAPCGGPSFDVWPVGLPQATHQKFLRSAAGAEESRGSDLNGYYTSI